MLMVTMRAALPINRLDKNMFIVLAALSMLLIGTLQGTCR